MWYVKMTVHLIVVNPGFLGGWYLNSKVWIFNKNCMEMENVRLGPEGVHFDSDPNLRV